MYEELPFHKMQECSKQNHLSATRKAIGPWVGSCSNQANLTTSVEEGTGVSCLLGFFLDFAVYSLWSGIG